MTKWSMAITAAVVALTASASWAGDILTPSLTVSSDSVTDLECTVLNAGTKVANVTISIHSSGAGATTESDTFSIMGGAARAVVETSLPGAGNFYCQVSGISKSKARVTFCSRDANHQCTVAVTAP
jgi:hypothetical protein